MKAVNKGNIKMKEIIDLKNQQGKEEGYDYIK